MASRKDRKSKKMQQKQSQNEQSRVGKRADDIFSPTKPAQQEKPLQEHHNVPSKTEAVQQEDVQLKNTRGRPVEHKEEWSKVTVVLLDKQIHWLDQLASTIRLKTKAAISRTELS